MIIESGEQTEFPSILDDDVCFDIIAGSLLHKEPVADEEINPTFDTAISHTEAPTLDTETDTNDKRIDRINMVKRYVGFTAVRQSANLEWAAGIVGGESVIQLLHTNRWATAAAVAGGVALLENKQSKWAANRIKNSNEELIASKDVPTAFKELLTSAKKSTEETSEDTRIKRVKRVAKATVGLLSATYREAAVLTSAAWQGAAATVEFNQTHGIESTPARIKVQSATFGTAVGLWLTPLPPFKRLNGYAREAFDYIIDSPIQSTAAGAVLSAGIFGLLNGYKSVKNKLLQRSNKPTSPIDGIAD